MPFKIQPIDYFIPTYLQQWVESLMLAGGGKKHPKTAKNEKL